MNSSVSIVKCKDYNPDLVQEAVGKAINLLGGIQAFIKPKARVLVKPNLLMAKEPEFGVTTHPEVVRAVVKILKEANCDIIVGDGPSMWGKRIENVAEVYQRSGIKRVCQEEGVRLVEFDKRRWRGKFPLTIWLDECDELISIPKFKTHDLMTLTGAVKNLFGLVSGTYKTELHKKYFGREDFARIVVDIYEEAKPTLTIVDGIVAMEGDGPATSGKLRELGLILAGADCVALDSVLAMIMGITPFDILTTEEAAKRGLGEGSIDSINILGEKLEDCLGKPFLLPTTTIKSKLPAPVIKLARKLIKYYPYVERDNCVACAACIQACPNQAVTLKDKRIIFDYAKCIACFCCQEACSYSAIKVKKSLLAKAMGL